MRADEREAREDEITSPVAASKRSRKDGGLNLRKSLAWNPAFFTEEGVLDSSELSIITGAVTKPSSKLFSTTNAGSSSMMQLDKNSERSPLNILEKNSLREVHSRSMYRIHSRKKDAGLFSISKASGLDRPPISTTLMRKPSTKSIAKNALTLDAACLMLEEEKAAKVQIEKDTNILKLNSCTSSSNISQLDTSCASTGMTCIAKEKSQNFCQLPSASIQAKQFILRMPSPLETLEQAKAAYHLFEKDLLKQNSYTPVLTKLSMDTTSGLVGIVSTSQQTYQISGLPPAPSQAKISALRMPSPSLGFFQEKTAASSYNDKLHKIAQVPISNTQSLRMLSNYKRMAPSKPAVTQTEQQSQKSTTRKIDNYFGKSGSPTLLLAAESSNLVHKHLETQTDKVKMKLIDKQDSVFSNVCGKSNSLPYSATEMMTSCLPARYSTKEKTRRVLSTKSNNERTKEFHQDNCLKSQNGSNTLAEGTEITKKVFRSSGMENANGSDQYCIDSIATENCPSLFGNHFQHKLEENNSKLLCKHALVMNNKKVMHKGTGDEINADYDMEELQCVHTVCDASEGASLNIEPKKEPITEGSAENGEGNFLKITFQAQKTISGKLQTGEVHAKSSQDVQFETSEECLPLGGVLLPVSRRVSSSVEENGLIKMIVNDNLKQDGVLHHLNAVPYSEQWMDAIEAFGEDVLEAKTGAVNNSPPNKDVPEPGPWSPIKRKSMAVGPYDCTKYTQKPDAWDD